MKLTKVYQFTENRIRYYILLDENGFDYVGSYLTNAECKIIINIDNKLENEFNARLLKFNVTL